MFPILSNLIEPSLRNFRISLSNNLFSSVGLGGSILSLEAYLRVSRLIQLGSTIKSFGVLGFLIKYVELNKISHISIFIYLFFFRITKTLTSVIIYFLMRKKDRRRELQQKLLSSPFNSFWVLISTDGPQPVLKKTSVNMAYQWYHLSRLCQNPNGRALVLRWV